MTENKRHGGGRARTGEIKQTAAGWAIRYRDAHGVRRQRGGFRTKKEAKAILDEELKKARLGPLYRPEATLNEVIAAFFEQYDGAPASHGWLRHYLSKATAVFGDVPVGELDALQIARWRASLPTTSRHGAHRALRQVLAAAVRWRWIEHNVAIDVRNPEHERTEFLPFADWDQVEAVARELGPFGPVAIFAVGTGVRPEELFGADWRDVDLDRGVITISRSFAKGRLKNYAKTAKSRRRVPLRSKVVDALEELPGREGILFPAAEGGRINIDNFRTREWVPALQAAGVEHRRIYDMRHTFATWSLASGVSIFTLARRMGTSVKMIDRTYGHLAHDADDHDREAMEEFDRAALGSNGHVAGTLDAGLSAEALPQNDETPGNPGVLEEAAEGTRTLDLLHGKRLGGNSRAENAD
ncbi:MAG: site-specific integrase [Conexibacteraceae bacterium]|nr:site-specific integrase [Conexibacteraceae bacterium]